MFVKNAFNEVNTLFFSELSIRFSFLPTKFFLTISASKKVYNCTLKICLISKKLINSSWSVTLWEDQRHWNPQVSHRKGRPKSIWSRTIIEMARAFSKEWREIKALAINMRKWQYFYKTWTENPFKKLLTQSNLTVSHNNITLILKYIAQKNIFQLLTPNIKKK